MLSNNPSGRYIVGAYTTSPNLFSWDQESEFEYFQGLKELPLIRGLELPFWGESLHPFDDKWLLSNLDPMWENVLTCVPGTMKRLEDNHYFGLASKNEKNREIAIKFYLKVFECVNNLKNQFGQHSVIGVNISSSPFINENQVYAHKDCLIKSLIEVVSWEWGRTKLFIEHCDAYNNNNLNPKKGFLPLDDEIHALIQVNKQCRSNLRIVINWGRSVIEFKSIEGPLIHLNKAVQHGVLGGLMFSGTTANDDNLYGAWSDLHMPPANYSDYKYFEKESLMTYENIKKALLTCNYNTLDCLGIKLLAMPAESTIEKRICINRDSMFLLDQAIREINQSRL